MYHVAANQDFLLCLQDTQYIPSFFYHQFTRPLKLRTQLCASCYKCFHPPFFNFDLEIKSNSKSSNACLLEDFSLLGVIAVNKVLLEQIRERNHVNKLRNTSSWVQWLIKRDMESGKTLFDIWVFRLYWCLNHFSQFLRTPSASCPRDWVAEKGGRRITRSRFPTLRGWREPIESEKLHQWNSDSSESGCYSKQSITDHFLK